MRPAITFLNIQLSNSRVNLMRKKDFSVLENNKDIWKNQEKCTGVVRTSAHCDITKVMLQSHL